MTDDPADEQQQPVGELRPPGVLRRGWRRQVRAGWAWAASLLAGTLVLALYAASRGTLSTLVTVALVAGVVAAGWEASRAVKRTRVAVLLETAPKVWIEPLATAVHKAEEPMRAHLASEHASQHASGQLPPVSPPTLYTITLPGGRDPAQQVPAAPASVPEIAEFCIGLPRPLLCAVPTRDGARQLAAELIRALLREPLKHQPPDALPVPVPVRVPAHVLPRPGRPPARRSTRHRPDDIAPWLTTHLVQTFDLSRRTAQTLIDHQLITPVIEDPDEDDATAAVAARQMAHALQYHAHGRYHGGLIAICQRGVYDVLTRTHPEISAAARVELAVAGGAA